METVAHRTLKRLATIYLRELGCQAVATEVHCPISRYRIDVAGYVDGARAADLDSGAADGSPRTIVIECKQSRADFLRHNERAADLLGLRERLNGIRRSIEEHRIKPREPQLRLSGSALFSEMEQWDFSASTLPSYQRVLSRLQQVDEALHGETKFFLIAHYCLADRLYIAAPRGMIRRRELPVGWGLLECPADCLESQAQGDLLGPAPALEPTIEAPDLGARAQRRYRMLRNIAVAASRAAEIKNALVR